MVAGLQPGKPQGAGGVVAVSRRIVKRARTQWPGVPILICGDSGFASPDMYSACEELEVDFLLGLGEGQATLPPHQRVGTPVYLDAISRTSSLAPIVSRPHQGGAPVHRCQRPLRRDDAPRSRARPLRRVLRGTWRGL